MPSLSVSYGLAQDYSVPMRKFSLELIIVGHSIFRCKSNLELLFFPYPHHSQATGLNWGNGIVIPFCPSFLKYFRLGRVLDFGSLGRSRCKASTSSISG